MNTTEYRKFNNNYYWLFYLTKIFRFSSANTFKILSPFVFFRRMFVYVYRIALPNSKNGTIAFRVKFGNFEGLNPQLNLASLPTQNSVRVVASRHTNLYVREARKVPHRRNFRRTKAHVTNVHVGLGSSVAQVGLSRSHVLLQVVYERPTQKPIHSAARSLRTVRVYGLFSQRRKQYWRNIVILFRDDNASLLVRPVTVNRVPLWTFNERAAETVGTRVPRCFRVGGGDRRRFTTVSGPGDAHLSSVCRNIVHRPTISELSRLEFLFFFYGRTPALGSACADIFFFCYLRPAYSHIYFFKPTTMVASSSDCSESRTPIRRSSYGRLLLS